MVKTCRWHRGNELLGSRTAGLDQGTRGQPIAIPGLYWSVTFHRRGMLIAVFIPFKKLVTALPAGAIIPQG